MSENKRVARALAEFFPKDLPRKQSQARIDLWHYLQGFKPSYVIDGEHPDCISFQVIGGGNNEHIFDGARVTRLIKAAFSPDSLVQHFSEQELIEDGERIRRSVLEYLVPSLSVRVDTCEEKGVMRSEVGKLYDQIAPYLSKPEKLRVITHEAITLAR